MKERSFDEMIAYFNRRVSEMDIAQDYKMELLGMVTALGYKHEKTAQQWIPCEREFPPNMKYVLVSDGMGVWEDRLSKHDGIWVESTTYQSDSYSWAWRELPEPWRGE